MKIFNIKTVTITCDSLGGGYLYLTTKEEVKSPNRQGKSSVGIDFGLKTFPVTSDGNKYESSYYYQALKDIKTAPKKISSKRKGSKNRKKASENVFRLYERIVNQRKDYFLKLAHELTDKYDYIFIEDLNLKAIQRMWGKKIQDLGYFSFINILLVKKLFLSDPGIP